MGDCCNSCYNNSGNTFSGSENIIWIVIAVIVIIWLFGGNCGINNSCC